MSDPLFRSPSVVGFALSAILGLTVPNQSAVAMDIARPLLIPSISQQVESPSSDKTSQLREKSSTQGKRVTISAKDRDIADVLEMISKKVDLPLLWSRDQVPLTGKVSISLENVPVMEALATVLRGTSAEARLSSDGKTIVIVRKAAPSSGPSEQQKSGVLTGQILDSTTRRGLARVTIEIVGTSLATTTTDDGQFVIRNVPVGTHTVILKLFGYRRIERRVEIREREGSTLNAVMAPTATVLSGVVTTVTGTQRRLEVTHDVTTLNVDSVMAVAPITSVTDLLESRVPGLQVIRTTGTPGDPSRLRLRGAGSITGNNAPIVIVDGVRIYSPDTSTNGARRRGLWTGSTDPRGYPSPSSLDQIDPNSIEKIEVFKGPTASALYGSDAANGVIAITTKRGRPGQTRWTATVNAGTFAIVQNFPNNVYLFGHRINEPSRICEFYEGCDIDSTVSFQALNDSRYSPLGRGSLLSASASTSGGTNFLTYSFTGSASREDGMTRLPGLVVKSYTEGTNTPPPSWMRRPDQYQMYSGNSSFQLTPSSSFTVTLNNSLSMSDQQRSSLGFSAGEQLLQRYVDPREFVVSPLLRGFQERAISTTLTVRNDVSARWNVTPMIPLNVRAGFNPNQTTGKIYIPRGTVMRDRTVSDTAGMYSVSRGNAIVSTLGANTVIPFALRNGLRLNLGIGGDVTFNSTNQHTISTEALPAGVTDPSTFDPAITRVMQYGVSTSTYGVFINPEISIGSRLFIQPGIRLDGGSATGDRAGLMRMPKVGMSWIAFDNVSDGNTTQLWQQLISQIKLRGAIGTAGIQPSPEQHLRLYEMQTGTIDGGQTVVPLYVPRSLGNTHLIPERSSEFEGGIDAGLLNQRVSLNMSFYRRTTRDAILDLQVPLSVGSVGHRNYYGNIGNIQNSGIELSSNARVIESPALAWDINVLFTQYRNRVTKLAHNAEQIGALLDNAQQVREGYPLSAYWARPIAGFTDNGDGILQPHEVVLADSVVYLGSTDPRYQTSFSTTVTLLNGRLSANAAFNYQNGLAQYNHNAALRLRSDANAPNATLEQQAVALTTYSGRAYTPYYLIQRINTFRFQSLAVQYQLPATFAQMLKFRNATVGLQGNNLGLRTNYSGKDPNVNAYSSGNFSADTGQLPQPRNWVLRFNLSR